MCDIIIFPKKLLCIDIGEQRNMIILHSRLIVLGICVALKVLNTIKRDDLKLVANYQIHVNYVTNFLFINVRFNNKKGFIYDKSNDSRNLRNYKCMETCKTILAKCKTFSTIKDWSQLS